MGSFKVILAISNGIWISVAMKLGKRVRNRILFGALYNQVAHDNYNTVIALETLYLPVDTLATVMDVNKVMNGLLNQIHNKP